MKILIFGCGKGGRKTFNFFNHKRYEILFSDNNSEIWNHNFLGRKIIPPMSIPAHRFHKVLIACSDSYSVQNQISKLGISISNLYIVPPEIIFGLNKKNSSFFLLLSSLLIYVILIPFFYVYSKLYNILN